VYRGRYESPENGINSAVLRAARSYEIDGTPAISYLQLGYGSIKPSGSLSDYPSDTGVSDLTLATAIWPYVNCETRTYFAVAGYVTVPTGSYSSQIPFNYGENRFKFDLQLGFQKNLV